jgi:DNA-binding response OmpR family regulator
MLILDVMRRILIVDDEIAVASVFETALKNAGFEVKVAPDAKTGIATATSEQFDLILLDQMLPDMSGNEILKILKQDERTKNLPISMLTNFGHDTMVKEALFAGANDYILKYQISTDDLVNKVKSLLGETEQAAA